MAKYQYFLNSKSSWMASSGNGLIAIANKSGSGKKISITGLQIYNYNKFGYTTTSNSNLPPPTKVKVGPVTALSGGTNITPVELDSNSSFPTDIYIKTGAGYTPTLVQVGQSLTQAGATAGATTFTPDSAPASPAWTTNEHRDACRYLYVASGSNAGTYRAVSNTATAMVISSALPATASTTGYVAEAKIYCQASILKSFNSSTTQSYPNINYGSYMKTRHTGQVISSNKHSNGQNITIRAGEKLAVFADTQHCPLPILISAILIVDGSPNRTYGVEFYTFLDSEGSALFSIDNASASTVIRLESFSISEVGNLDTCYFQIVPISGVGSAAYNDSLRKITSQATRTDSTHTALSSSVCDIFTNVPLLPYGVPTSYISPSSVNAIPNSVNYLNTKDFIGPVYMAYFPESAAYKIQDTNFWGTSTPGTLGTHISQELSTIKGRFAPIVLREGEGLAIVSGVETAAGSTVAFVGASGWVGFDFSMSFNVEPATSPSLNFTNLLDGTEVRVMTYGTNTEVAGTDSSSGGTFSWAYGPDLVTSVDVNIIKLGYEVIRYNNLALGSTSVSIPITQRIDRNEYNP